jgi:hypothetical protein
MKAQFWQVRAVFLAQPIRVSSLEQSLLVSLRPADGRRVATVGMTVSSPRNPASHHPLGQGFNSGLGEETAESMRARQKH